MSRWVSSFGACKILEVADPRSAERVLAKAGILSRQLPGKGRQWDREAVQRVADEAIIPAINAVAETAVA